MKVCYLKGKSYAGEVHKKENMSKKLELKDKAILVEGEWNMINFTSDLIKAMVDEVLAMKPEDQKNRLELYNDHWESVKAWIGQASNLRWDEKEKAAKADLTIIDEPTIKKLKFQIEEQKKNDWGISPCLKLERDKDGTLIKISLRNLSLVVDPAQGKETALERLKNAEETITTLKKELEKTKLEKPNKKGDGDMIKFNIADLNGKSAEETKAYGITFLGQVNDELKKIKKDIAGDSTPVIADMQRDLSNVKTHIESLKTKVATEEQAGCDLVLDEVEVLSNLIKKLSKAAAPKLELLPVMRLNFEGDNQFQSIGAKRYKKELIRESSYLDPRDMTSVLKVTPERIDGWISNFKRDLKRVPIPLRHTDDPMKNTGWIVDLMKENGSLYGICEFTNPVVEESIQNGSIKDVSVGIDPDFVDTKTGRRFGEALEHVALTVVPHITNLSQFEPIAAEYKREVIEMKPVKKETKNVNDSAYMELVNSNQTLQKKVASLEKDRDINLQDVVTNRVAKLVADGRLTPGLKDRVLSFALAGRSRMIELEKDVQKCIGEEFLGILEGLEITFEMVQKSRQTSDISDNRKYCSPEDFSTGSLKGDGYKQALKDKKVILESGTGRAYWVA